MKKTIIAVLIASIAFAYIESAVVIYLRTLYYPDSFPFPLKIIPTNILIVEVCRDISTIILLAGLAYIAGRNFLQRCAYFIFSFGVWDIFYYLWLKVILDWPESIFSWDILYLVPLPWSGPVISPLIISTCMITVALIVLHYEGRGRPITTTRWDWFGMVVAALIIILSYLWNFLFYTHDLEPEYYPWSLFLIGIGLGLIIFIRRVWFTNKDFIYLLESFFEKQYFKNRERTFEKNKETNQVGQ